jgi:hypothetical protein
MIISSAVGIRDLLIEKLTVNYADYLFIKKNILNDYFIALMNGVNYFADNMRKNLSQDES